MVSKASEDLPDPETPVTTVMALCGISKSMFLRLWTRAPRTTILSLEISDIRIQKRPSAEIRMPPRTEGSESPAESFYYKAGKSRLMTANKSVWVQEFELERGTRLSKCEPRTGAMPTRKRRSGQAERSSGDSTEFQSRERLRCLCSLRLRP